MTDASRQVLGVWNWDPTEVLLKIFMESPFLSLILLIPVLSFTRLIRAFRSEEIGGVRLQPCVCAQSPVELEPKDRASRGTQGRLSCH